MIKIKQIVKDGKVSLEFKGHADLNPGNDPVCAAVSMLVCTFANWLQVYFEEKVIRTEIRHGYALFVFEIDTKSLWAVSVIWCGYLALAKEFPKNVEVEEIVI